jgi:hypothetical protein
MFRQFIQRTKQTLGDRYFEIGCAFPVMGGGLGVVNGAVSYDPNDIVISPAFGLIVGCVAGFVWPLVTVAAVGSGVSYALKKVIQSNQIK